MLLPFFNTPFLVTIFVVIALIYIFMFIIHFSVSILLIICFFIVLFVITILFIAFCVIITALVIVIPILKNVLLEDFHFLTRFQRNSQRLPQYVLTDDLAISMGRGYGLSVLGNILCRSLIELVFIG